MALNNGVAKLVGVFVRLAGAVLAVVLPVTAEDASVESSPEVLSSDLSLVSKLLPEPGPNNEVFLTVQASNAPQLKSLIVPEIYPLVRDGQLSMPAVRELHFEWRYDDEFLQASEAFKPETLVDDKKILQLENIGRFLPFGAVSAQDSFHQSVAHGQALLWNLQSHWWSYGYVGQRFVFSSFVQQRLERSLRGIFQRIYPVTIQKDRKGNQLFRELLKFEDPKEITGLALLGIRQMGEEEDSLWLYSPALKKTRQLTGSNRADPLLRSPFALEDFSPWSGKSEMVEPRFLGEGIFLAPFPSVKLAVLKNDIDERSCLSTGESAAGTSSHDRTKFDFQKPAEWLLGDLVIPRDVRFSPRRLWKIELSPKDPFLQQGRIVLYIDPIMMLPMYKMVYNRAGDLWRIGMLGFGLASTEDNSRRIPYLGFNSMYDLKQRNSGLLEFSEHKFCSQYPKGITLGLFDPSRLGPTG